MLPPDSHVHSEWSWDAVDGSMERTCARAVELGLPAIAFTEHAEFAGWTIALDVVTPEIQPMVSADNLLAPPPMNVEGYLECLQRCRERFPGLRIISGAELSEPHRHPDRVKAFLAAGGFERVLASVHTLPGESGFVEASLRYEHRPAVEVVRAYLADVTRLIEEHDSFAVLAHIDYPIRDWPASAGPYDPQVFEEEIRTALRALASSGRALEVNTRLPLHSSVVEWWRDVGGAAVAFGSDAHEPSRLAHGFAEAAAMVEAHGFRPGRHPYDFWIR